MTRLKRTHEQVGRYSKNKGARFELATAKKLTKWVRPYFGKKASFSRTYSSGATSNSFTYNAPVMLGDIFPMMVPGWCFSIECKNYKSTRVFRYYMQSKRLQRWLYEVTHDSRRHQGNWCPMLITRDYGFDSLIMLPCTRWLFVEMTDRFLPCWVTRTHYKIKRTGHIFRFDMILTNLKALMKINPKKLVEVYSKCDWDKFNKKYTKNLTYADLRKDARARMSKTTQLVKKTIRHK